MARKTTVQCNLCGKVFDEYDRNQDFSIYRRIVYGSDFDGCFICIDICNSCLDKLIDSCVISPVMTESEQRSLD